MRSLDEGLQWHPATMWYAWYPASSLGMFAGVVVAVLAGFLVARAVTIHSNHVSLSAPRLAAQRIMLKSTKPLPAEAASPAIWIPATLMEASRIDYAFPAAAVAPHEADKQGARSRRAFARRKHVPSKARSVRQRRASKVHMARALAKKRVALSKKRRKVVQRAPARGMEVARGRTRAKSRRARTNRVKAANERRLRKPAVTQHRRFRRG